jgi:rod shape-determining protein MreB
MLNNMIFKKIIGIDLGSNTTKVYLKGTGVILNEPSIIAFNNRSNRVIAVGAEAKKMLSRTPLHITALRPVVNGVIADFDMTKEMLLRFLKSKLLPWSWITDVVLAIPTNLTEVERKSVEDLLREIGMNKVYLIERPIVAALGAGLDVSQPSAHLILDVGAGTTDMAVISFSGVVTSRRLKIAGNYFDQEIVKGVREEMKLYIGDPTAEEIKNTIGSVLPQPEKLEMVVRGRDVATGLPKEISIRDTQIRYWLQKPVKILIENLKELIDSTPAELVGDVYKNGIYLVGGGSLLRGLSQFIEKDVGVKVQIVDNPILDVVRGIGIITENLNFYKNILEDFSFNSKK